MSEISHGKRQVTIAVICISLAVCALFAYLQGEYPNDDTFIHLRYVKNLVEHNQFTYNLDQPSYSTTSPLWNLIVAYLGMPFLRGGMDYLLHARIVAIAFALLASLALLAYAKQTCRNVALFVPVLFLLDPYVTSVVSCAMEQCLFVLLGASGLILLHRRKPGHSRYLVGSGLFFALQFVTRPEGAVFVLASLLYLLYRRELSEALILLASTLVFLVPFLVYFAIHFGSLLPLTLMVKTTDPRGHLPLTDLVSMKELLRLFLQVYAIPIIAVAALHVRFSSTKMASVLRRNSIATAVVVILFIAYLALLKEKAISNRYLVNFTPFLLLILASMVGDFRTGRARATGIALLVGVFLILNVIAIPTRIQRGRRLALPRIEIGKWLRENTTETASVYVGDIGYIGFYSQRTIYDFTLIERPGAGQTSGVLRRRGELDVAEAIRKNEIDYVVAGEAGIPGLELELVHQTRPYQEAVRPRYIYKVVK